MTIPSGTPLGNLRMLEVWDYYDGPRLFAAQNATGTLHIALWADQDSKTDSWLYVPVSEFRLEAVRSGAIPIRDAFLEPEDGRLYDIVVSRTDNVVVRATAILPDQIDLERLPPIGDRLSLERAPTFAKVPGKLATHWVEIQRLISGRTVGLNVVTAILAAWRGLFQDAMGHLGAAGELIPLVAESGSFRVALGSESSSVADQVLEILARLTRVGEEPGELARLAEIGIDADRIAALFALLSAHKVKVDIVVPGRGRVISLSPVDSPTVEAFHEEFRSSQPLDGEVIPQADDLERVFRVLDITAAHQTVDSYTLSVTPRQVNYYRQACRILGYFSRENRPTTAGWLLPRLELEDRLKTTAMQFEHSECGLAWIRWSRGRTLMDVSSDSAEEFLASVARLSKDTTRRRSQTLRKWHADLLPYHYKASTP